MGQYYVVDLETSVKNRGDESVGSFKASPFHPENHIVLGGVRQEHAATTTHKMPGTFWSWPHKIPVPEDCDLLIGHNIGFDLLYLIKDSHEWRDWMRTGMIWDTMLAEYLITGQEKKFASLDNCAEKYGGTLKDERIKEYWENGMDTEDIPKVELAKYLIGDIDNTELVFLKQIEIAHEMGLLELIQTQMEARLATVEMEYNGMFFNRDTCNYAVATMEGHLAVLDAAIDVEYRDVFPTAAWGDINPKSNQQLALYLFGGKLKYRGTEPVLDEDGQIKHYKTGPSKGQVKTRKCDKYHEIHGILVGSCWSTKGKSGIYSTDNSVLENIRMNAVPKAAVEMADKVLKMREVEKDLGTYFEGYSKLCWPTDSCIHPSYNHTQTWTGRLSCSSPNVQNSSHE